jgi:rare lipoprotein A (peptidoglycan hydrolase)
LLMDHGTSRRGVVLAALVVAALVLIATAMPAGAHPYIPRWYQYDKVVWHYGWPSRPTLVAEHDQWHRNHPHATWDQNVEFHHVLRARWRYIHFHGALAYRDGKVTWYDGTGKVGACGVRLYGLYAASRTLPCGALVSVRHDGHYVFVKILDRGPFGDSSRILDLSPKAFQRLAPLSTGVIPARTVQLRKR